jgi:CPA1 family monovalent cation:H+ antiporter
LLLLFVVVFAELARRLKVPYPIVLVIAGGLLGLVPGIPKVTLNPDTIFFVILPPLLYSAAWLTSWREFSYNLVGISFLAIGLVAFTVLGVAFGVHWLFPGFDWRVGVVLGAVIAPTDALAATSIAKRIGLPKRIVDVLEGESLVNDATGLLALEFGLAMVMGGAAPSVSGATIRLVYLTVAGLAVGLATGWIVDKIERRIDHGPIEIALSILVPYVAYYVGNGIKASGVLSVVACGLFLARRSSDFFSPGVRLQVWAVWESLTFILNGLVFVLIGLQLPFVREVVQGTHPFRMALYGLLFSAFVIALRMLWIFPGTYFSILVRRHLLHQKETMPPASGIVVVGWTGMRGVIALAAAMALPQTLPDGSPFPNRALIIFLAFTVIFVTLVLQGLTLPRLVRALGLAAVPESRHEEEDARKEIVQAALTYLEDARKHDEEDFDVVYEDLVGHYQQRLNTLSDCEEKENTLGVKHHKRFSHLSRELVHIERRTAIRLRNEGKINDEILRQLERELDLREAGPSHESG